MKRFLSLLLAGAMLLSLAACGDETTGGGQVDVPDKVEVEPNTDYVGPDWTAIDAMDYDQQSDAVYDFNLGEFASTYATAKEELDNTDLRAALMAVSEAKLLETGVFIPLTGDAGNYAMSRAVPRSVTTTSWGIDEYRMYTALACNEIMKKADRDTLTAMWKEAATADDFFAQAKSWLADNGYTLNDSYNANSAYELASWDVIATSYTSDSFFIAPTYTGLMEYDAKNTLQPAMAESYEISDDGTVYTFHIRPGVNWVDQQGRVIGEVTADDWVASMEHLADNNDALGYLMSASDGCGIKNYDAYISGEVAFSEVGVKALDTYTLQYTLEKKFPAFITMLGYGCFAPLNRQFYQSQGGTFGADGVEYTPGNYGTSPDTIAYNGAFIITNFTAKNVTSYAANPEYYDPDALNIHALNYYYIDGTDPLRSYNDAKAGTIVGTGFNSNALELAKTETPEGETGTYFELYSYTTQNSATTYCGWVNMNRKAFANYNDATVGVSPKSDEEKARAREALNNQNFRMAIAMAFDRGAYNALSVGEDLKYAALKNSYVTGNFIQLQSDVTIDINGESHTYPAGTYYGVILQDQLSADGYPIKVWDPTADGGAGSGDGFDGWYNVDNARSFLNNAIAELANVGVEVSADKPIYIDFPYGAYSEVATNQANAYKQSIENALENKVIVNLIAFEDRTTENDATYRFATGADGNFDVSTGSGWGPDYGDAQSFLDTIQAYGYMCKNLGVY